MSKIGHLSRYSRLNLHLDKLRGLEVQPFEFENTSLFHNPFEQAWAEFCTLWNFGKILPKQLSQDKKLHFAHNCSACLLSSQFTNSGQGWAPTLVGSTFLKNFSLNDITKQPTESVAETHAKSTRPIKGLQLNRRSRYMHYKEYLCPQKSFTLCVNAELTIVIQAINPVSQQDSIFKRWYSGKFNLWSWPKKVWKWSGYFFSQTFDTSKIDLGIITLSSKLPNNLT